MRRTHPLLARQIGSHALALPVGVCGADERGTGSGYWTVPGDDGWFDRWSEGDGSFEG